MNDLQGYVVKSEYQKTTSDRLLVTFCYPNGWVQRRQFYPMFIVENAIRSGKIKILESLIH